MKIVKSLLFVLVIMLLGCSQKISNPFVETRKATAEYTDEGAIDTTSPIIKEPKKQNILPRQQMQQQKYQDQLKDEYEKVGYIVNVQTEPSSGLYVYTLTNALRTDRIQFYSKYRLPYSERDLIRVYIKDNYVISHEPYKTVTGKRKRSILQVAKESVINIFN